MIKKSEILDIINQFITVRCLDEDYETWKSIQNDTVVSVPVWYSYDNVIYQFEYFKMVFDELIDVSSVIYNGGVPVGIWPLSIAKNHDGEICLLSNGGSVLAPLFLEKGYNVESKRKLYEKCINVLEAIIEECEITRVSLSQYVKNEGIDIWTQKLFEHGWICNKLNNECYLDLTRSEEEILSSIRRTNKYSIQKSGELYQQRLITHNNSVEEVKEVFESFRNLHIEIAGRETRSKKTWDLQCEAVISGNGFVVLLYDEERLIGASLWNTTYTEGSYSVAAYDRSLFDKPVGHISQWIAIQYMKELGLKWYYIGERSYSNDWNHPTEKEVAIGHFKEGWATNIYPKLTLEKI